LYLYFLVFGFWRRPPVTVAAAASAMAPYHRLKRDIDWEEEAEQLRLEGFTDKANKLVALFYNLRLIWRMATLKYVEPAVDHTDSDDALFVSGVTTFGL
jgi:hypothetical protein